MINEKLNNAVTPIRDRAQLTGARSLIVDIMSSSEILNPNWLTLKNWVATPIFIEDSVDSFAERLQAGAISLGCRICLGVFTQDGIDLEKAEAAYTVPMTTAGLNAFDRERVGLGYALVPLDQSFVVAYSEDILIVGGPRAFTEAVVGARVADAYHRFCKIAVEWKKLSAHADQYFAKIEKHYARFGVRP